MTAAPRIGEFEYEVSVQVYLPEPHANLLHESALHHYDSKVRASAASGPIHALRNIALCTAAVHARPAASEGAPLPHRLTAREIDTCIKALEHPIIGRADDHHVLNETRAILRQAFAACTTRAEELASADTRAARAERHALLRLVKVFPGRVATPAMFGTWRVVQAHPHSSRSSAVTLEGATAEDAIEASRYLLPYFPEEAFA